MSGDWSQDTRDKAADRSEGRCERCGLRRAVHLHHRLLRANGNHDISNALHVCVFCHNDIHESPLESYRRGWLLASDPQCKPAEAVVLYRGEKVRLSTDGFVLLPPVA